MYRPQTQSPLFSFTRSSLFLLLLTNLYAFPFAVNAQVTPQAINVQDAEIGTILKVFSKRLKRNYILDERVKGKVTMFLPGEISIKDSLQVLDTVLALKGFTTVPIGDNIWKVVPSKEAKQSTIPTVSGEGSDNIAGAVVTKLVRLNHITASEVQPIVQSLISSDGLVSAYEGTNALIVIDYADNVERISALVESLDLPFFDQDMTMIPVTHADAVDLAEKLRELLLENGGESASSASVQPVGITSPRRVSQRRTGTNATQQTPNTPRQGGQSGRGQVSSRRARQPKILADERTNSIIVVADDETTARIRAIVAELDSSVDRSTNRFYVYRCQHADAEELAAVLAGLVGGAPTGAGGGAGLGGNPSSLRNRNSSLSGRNSQLGRTNDRLGQTRRQPGQPRQNSGSAGPTSVQLGENFSITADPATNSLIINAPRSDYEKVLELLTDLDIKRRQVLVEAMILEVGVRSEKVLGTDFLTSTGGADGAVLAQSNLGGSEGLLGLLSDPRNLSGFSVAAASAGSISLPGDIVIPSQAILISAAQTNNNVNVLSAPTLLATDNEEAEIVVGQNVPFLASTSTSDVNLNNTFNQIDRQDVGITLRLTPQISSNDFVTLNLFTDVSSVIPSADATLGPTTTVRSSETTVITKDGQMIVIGGLMADESNDSETGIPFLKDIPVFGQLFRRSTDNINRTNLLTFIIPTIVKDQYDARETTLSMREDTEDVIERDGHFPKRTEILRSRRIDSVAELSPEEVADPGTIRPPAKAIREVQRRKEKVGVPTSTVPAQQRQLPKEKIETPEANLKKERLDIEVPPLLPDETLPPPAAQPAPEGSIAILRLQGGDGKLPFRTNSQGVFAIDLSQAPENVTSSLLTIGNSFRLGESTGSTSVKVIGRSSSKEEASQEYSLSKETWYTMSPFELMNFGRGPWYRNG